MNSSRVLLLIIALVSVAPATRVLPQDEWPGTYGTVSGFSEKLYRYWLPDTCRTVRGIYLTEDYGTLGHDESCPLGVLRFAFIQYSGDPSRNYGDNSLSPPTAQQLLAFIAAVAGKTGHSELLNCPMVWNGQFDNSWISSSFSGRVIGQRRWMGDGSSTPLYEAREETSERKPSVAFANRGPRYTWSVQWGWGHGGYSGRDLWWPWVTELVRFRVPKDWDPRKGKPTLREIPQDSVWLGDPSSVFGDWPYIASYNQYSKSKSGAVWLPGARFAYIWRAFSSRHLTETQGQQGEAHVGDAASTYGFSGQPNFMVTAPSRPYNLKKTGGKNYPVVPVDTQLVIKGAEFGINRPGVTMRKVEFYDGNYKLGELARNAYAVYQTPRVKLHPVAGTHSIIAIVTVEENGKTRQFTSRPATVFVTDVGGSAATVIIPTLITAGAPKPLTQRLTVAGMNSDIATTLRAAADPLGRIVPIGANRATSMLIQR